MILIRALFATMVIFHDYSAQADDPQANPTVQTEPAGQPVSVIQQRGRIAPDELSPGNYHCTHILRDAHGVNYTMRDFNFTVS